MNRHITIWLLTALLSVGLFSTVVYAAVENKPIGGQRFTGEVLVNASPEKVWSVLTNSELLSETLDYQFISGKKRVQSVGDAARVKVWGDGCTYLLTYVDLNKELRLSLEPDNGSYICRCRWILTPAGKGTKVQVIEEYTESGTQSTESLQGQVEDWEKTLAELKEKAEG